MNLRERIAKDVALAIRGQHLELSEDKIEVTRSIDSKFGDYSTNIAFGLAKGEGRKAKGEYLPPIDFAKKLAVGLQDLSYIKKVEVKQPGFINFWVKDDLWQEQVGEVIDQGFRYGSNELGKGKKARVEFVSANPTGPLHFGNARGGPIGDSLASVLEFSGYKVLREYLNNDRGNQVMELGQTIAFHLGLNDKGDSELAYQGEYAKELAAKIKLKIGKVKNLSKDEVAQKAGELAVKMLYEEIIGDCAAMGIKYDQVVSESELQEEAPKTLADFEKRGLLKKSEGAVWFGDKGAVVIKSDGTYTYFTADLVYHKQKFESGYDLVIDVFGSNTSGHVPKLRALADVLGFDQEKFKVILYQFVRIKMGSDVVRMSKRTGNFVTLREALNEVGRDALRFFILMHDANTHMDFDLELAKKKSSDNPVYYVQYAYARIASILAKIKDKGLKTKVDYELLSTHYELGLIKQILRFPELVEDISKSFAIHQLTRYAIELAETFHKFYENCRVLEEKEELKNARLALVKATRITLATTLRLLGVSALEKM